jgi:DtxR family Mn-dependent transcriptional regulator
MLEGKEDCARTNDIASMLKVQPASVTEMLKKLREKGLVAYRPYRGARLTHAGRSMASALTKKHETLARFLEILGVYKEIADIDACKIEHYVAPETVECLKKFVEFVQDAPREPLWLKQFRHFSRTGERSRTAGDLKDGKKPRRRRRGAGDS